MVCAYARSVIREAHPVECLTFTPDGDDCTTVTTTLRLVDRQHEAENVTSFLFEPEAPISYQAGQYLSYRLPHQDPEFFVSGPTGLVEAIRTTLAEIGVDSSRVKAEAFPGYDR
jgi:ferredoxin-NADP reductase